MPGMAGCLPVFLQLPIFIALSRVLTTSIELYKAPFLWISDLSAKDPYYILPILTGICMLLQPLSENSKQRMLTLVMPVVLAAVLSGFSAGLALYIFVSTFLGVLQTKLVKKHAR